MPVQAFSARLVLRKKVNQNSFDPIEKGLYQKLSLNEYKKNSLTIEEQNYICTIIEHKLNIDMKEILKPLGLGNNYYANSRMVKNKYVLRTFENLFMMIIVLSENNIQIDYDMSLKMCQFWNDTVDIQKTNEFAKIKIKDKMTKKIICTSIALTYALYFKTNSVDKIRNAIEKILDVDNGFAFYSQKKYSIYEIFADKMLSNKKFNLMFEIKNSIKFRMDYYYNGSKHENTFNGKFKNKFISVFFEGREEKGIEIFNDNKTRLSKWFDSMSFEFTRNPTKRDTCGLKFISQNENINSLLEEYFLFLTTQKSNPLPTDLVKEGWWASFVDHIRFNYGYSNFWKWKIKVRS